MIEVKKDIFKTNKIYKSPEHINKGNENNLFFTNSRDNNFKELINIKKKNNLQNINDNEKDETIISISSYENGKSKGKKTKKKMV